MHNTPKELAGEHFRQAKKMTPYLWKKDNSDLWDLQQKEHQFDIVVIYVQKPKKNSSLITPRK